MPLGTRTGGGAKPEDRCRVECAISPARRSRSTRIQIAMPSPRTASRIRRTVRRGLRFLSAPTSDPPGAPDTPQQDAPCGECQPEAEDREQRDVPDAQALVQQGHRGTQDQADHHQRQDDPVDRSFAQIQLLARGLDDHRHLHPAGLVVVHRLVDQHGQPVHHGGERSEHPQQIAAHALGGKPARRELLDVRCHLLDRYDLNETICAARTEQYVRAGSRIL